MKKDVRKIEIAPGYFISRILKGGWQLAGGHGKIDEKKAISDMKTYLDSGITTFDCADIYTGVEELIGKFIKTFKVKVPEELQVHTKYVPDLALLPAIKPKDTEAVIDRSLKRLGIERLNLVQFHWWDYDIPKYIDTALTLQMLQKKGKIQFIGATNFDTLRLQELIDAGVSIVSSQNQYSVIDNRPEKKLTTFTDAYNIKLLCYGTAAGGFLSEKYLGVKEPREPFENRSLIKYKLIIDDFGGWELFQELLKTLNGIARKHNTTITNISSRYTLDKAGVAGIIIGARNSTHLLNNLHVFKLCLDKNDEIQIKNILDKSQELNGDVYFLERLKGGKHAGIMKYNLNKV